jgi:hypothetical protein
VLNLPKNERIVNPTLPTTENAALRDSTTRSGSERLAIVKHHPEGVVPMKTCTVYGDMAADSAADQYPTVTLCDDCVEADKLKKADSQIVSTEAYDPDYGESCEWCGVEASEEKGA